MHTRNSLGCVHPTGTFSKSRAVFIRGSRDDAFMHRSSFTVANIALVDVIERVYLNIVVLHLNSIKATSANTFAIIT
jgi:hypothetical protein